MGPRAALHIPLNADRSSAALSAANTHARLVTLILYNLLQFYSHHLHSRALRRKISFCPQTKPKHCICQRHSFILNSSFYPFTSILSTTPADLMTDRPEKKSRLPGNCVCIDCGFCSREAMGGKRRRREVRGCGEDSCGLAQAAVDERRPSLAGSWRTSCYIVLHWRIFIE